VTSGPVAAAHPAEGAIVLVGVGPDEAAIVGAAGLVEVVPDEAAPGGAAALDEAAPDVAGPDEVGQGCIWSARRPAESATIESRATYS